jgi:hypothetical protein
MPPSKPSFPGLLVLPHARVPGWDGRPDTLAQTQTYPIRLTPDAWREDYPTDAHAVGYLVDGEDALPRLTLRCAPWLEEQGAPVRMHWMLVDVDNPGHRPWDDDLLAETGDLLAELPWASSMGWYLTPGGYRLVWQIKDPVPVSIWADWRAMFHDALRSHGIEPDDACLDWTRLFRMPRALRPGHGQLDLEMDLENVGTLDWTPPREPLAGRRRSRRRTRTTPVDLPDLSKLTLPGKREFASIKNVDQFQRLSDGLPIDAPDGRNNAVVRMLGQIVAKLQTEDPLVPFRFMLASFQNTFKDGDEEDEAWLWARCVWVTDLMAGQLEEHEEHEQEQREARLGLLDQLAANTGLAREEIGAHVIISDGRTHYVLDQHDGSYGPAIAGSLLLRELRRRCPDLALTTNGRGNNLDDRELLARYSTTATEVRMVLGAEQNVFDPVTGTMREAAAPMRDDVEPEYNGEIARWLELLGGEHHDRLLDWLATYDRFGRPTCALYIHGARGIGKGLLGEGLGRLHTAGAVDFETLTESFTEHLSRSALVWADEVAVVGHDTTASALFRRLIGSSQMVIRRKFKSEAIIEGAHRLLITANNPDALRVREMMTQEDIAAVVQRIGYIQCLGKQADACRAYLASLGGRDYTERWVAEDGLARHVLWLVDTRGPQVQSGDRYLVEGWNPSYAEDMVTRTSLQGEVLTALVEYLQGGTKDRGMPVTDGRLYVNASALVRRWTSLLGQHARPPSQNALATALRSISDEQARLRPPKGKQMRAWAIRTSMLIHAAESMNLADASDIQSTLARDDFAGDIKVAEPKAKGGRPPKKSSVLRTLDKKNI